MLHPKEYLAELAEMFATQELKESSGMGGKVGIQNAAKYAYVHSRENKRAKERLL